MLSKTTYIVISTSAILFFLIFYITTPIFFKQDSSLRKGNGQNKDNQEHVTENPISLLFIGDIMLDRTIRKDGERLGYDNLFSCLIDSFSPYNEVIGNLEGTVTNYPSVSRGAAFEAPESFRFTFDILALKALTDIGLSIVSIANNHIRDFGNEGINQTISNSESLELLVFGDPRPNQTRWIIQNINGTKIAYIAYNEFFGTAEQTLSDLHETKLISDIQIVYAHWGDEYVPARSDTKKLARTFVDNGADLIIGGHPHVIQEKELYQSTWIYYSLGNFIFDQYWEDAVRKGLAVSVQILNKKIEVVTEKHTLSSRNSGTCFIK